MNTETEKALQESIAKWRKLSKVETLEGIELGPDECPLCALFIRVGCEGCPVMDDGNYACGETPYEDADIAFELGVHASTVWKKRKELNIEPCELQGHGNWRDPKLIAKLGKMPDEKLGALIGISALAVKAKRNSMGIAPF